MCPLTVDYSWGYTMPCKEHYSYTWTKGYGRAPLTEKQQNVYESIMQYQRVNGYAPTIREICKMVGVASTSSVYAHLKILEEKGYIARKMDASRAIAIL